MNFKVESTNKIRRTVAQIQLAENFNELKIPTSKNKSSMTIDCSFNEETGLQTLVVQFTNKLGQPLGKVHSVSCSKILSLDFLC
jgi:hypothetical protein